MIKVASEAGFAGIEPMVLEIAEEPLGCCKYWLGDFCDPIRMKDSLQEYNLELAGLALVCAWDGEDETPAEREAADFTIDFLKHFPGAMLGTVTLPSGRKENLQRRRLNIARNINRVSSRATDAGLVVLLPPEQPAGFAGPHPVRLRCCSQLTRSEVSPAGHPMWDTSSEGVWTSSRRSTSGNTS